MRIWLLNLCVILVSSSAIFGQSKPEKKEVTDPALKAILETFTHQDQQIEKAAAKADAAVKAIGEVQKQNMLTEDKLKIIGVLAREIVTIKGELADTHKASVNLRDSLPKPTEDRAKSDEVIKQVMDRLAKLESMLAVTFKTLDAKIDVLPPVVRARYIPNGSKWDCTFRDKTGEGKFQFVVTNRDGDNVSGSCNHESKIVYTVSGTVKNGVWTFNQHFVPAAGPGRIKRTFTLTSDGTKFIGSSPGFPSLSSAGDLEIILSK